MQFSSENYLTRTGAPNSELFSGLGADFLHKTGEMLPFRALLRRKLLLWKIEELIRTNFSGRIFGEEFEGKILGGRIFVGELLVKNYRGRTIVEEF